MPAAPLVSGTGRKRQQRRSACPCGPSSSRYWGWSVLFAAWLVATRPFSEPSSGPVVVDVVVTRVVTGEPSDLEQSIAVDPELAEAYVSHGNAYFDKGELDQAIADYNQAIALDPQYAAAYFNRGGAYLAKGYYEQAIADYDQVIALDPQDTDAYLNRGAAYYHRGDLDRAVADIDLLITLDPQHVQAYFFRGRLHKELGEPEKAIADLEGALAMGLSPSQKPGGRRMAQRTGAETTRVLRTPRFGGC